MQNLSKLFDLFRFEVSIYNNAKFCGNWVVNEKHIGQTCFHMPTEGECLLRFPDKEEVLLNQGDLVIFPYETEHSLCSTSLKHEEFSVVEYPTATKVEGVGMLCGSIVFTHTGSANILEQLPSYFIIKNEESLPWLSQLLSLILEESYINNTSIILNRLSEILFIKAISNYVENSQTDLGFLNLYTNKKLSKVIDVIHETPGKKWDLNQLSSLSNMSHTSFQNHFKKTSGMTVIQYLTWWRMQMAFHYLTKGETVGATAEKVGYQSIAAFSRAFKREFGTNVGELRRKHLD